MQCCFASETTNQSAKIYEKFIIPTYFQIKDHTEAFCVRRECFSELHCNSKIDGVTPKSYLAYDTTKTRKRKCSTRNSTETSLSFSNGTTLEVDSSDCTKRGNNNNGEGDNNIYLEIKDNIHASLEVDKYKNDSFNNEHEEKISIENVGHDLKRYSSDSMIQTIESESGEEFLGDLYPFQDHFYRKFRTSSNGGEILSGVKLKMNEEAESEEFQSTCQFPNCILCKLGRDAYGINNSSTLRDIVTAGFLALYENSISSIGDCSKSLLKRDLISRKHARRDWIHLREITNFLEVHWVILSPRKKKTTYFRNAIRAIMARYSKQFECKSGEIAYWRLTKESIIHIDRSNRISPMQSSSDIGTRELNSNTHSIDKKKSRKKIATDKQAQRRKIEEDSRYSSISSSPLTAFNQHCLTMENTIINAKENSSSNEILDEKVMKQNRERNLCLIARQLERLHIKLKTLLMNSADVISEQHQRLNQQIQYLNDRIHLEILESRSPNN